MLQKDDTLCNDMSSTGKILIVEDEKDMADLLDFRLKKENYTTFMAHDGLSACHIIEDKKPDLVLLDIMLPKMNGWEVCNFIRSNRNSEIAATPIIMMTALGAHENKIKGLQCGADSYIPKPYSVKEVLLKCRNLLSSKGKHSSLQNQIEVFKTEKKDQEDMNSMLHHELRSHLNIILALCKRLKKNMPENISGENNNKYLLSIEKSSLHLSGITDEISLLHNMTHENFRLSTEHFFMKDIVDEAVSSYQSLARLKKLIITSELINLDEKISLNKIAVKLILSNLLENAVKYSNPKSEIKILSERKKNGTFSLSVTDSGIGIQKNDLEFVFNRFYRTEKAKRRCKGSGLGLYTIKKLTEEMGGQVNIISEEDKGCKVSVIFTPQEKSAKN
ncbi:MAG: response regulator [Desulfobulbaceae bacterium]|nr:response regulator [Desulfobulbaceae bacterium]